MKWFMLLLVFILNIAMAKAEFLPENHAVNGGLTIIPIDIKQQPAVFLDKEKIAVVPSSNANQWLLVVGIPLANNQPILQLTMTKPLKAVIPFHVSNKFYATQYITLDDQRKADPYAEDRARITRETQEMAQIFAVFTNSNPFATPFTAPAHGPVSSLFGLKRVYNHHPQAPHSGLDIAAAEDSPVVVAAPGKVAAIRDYFFTGNTVIVDHGMGVFSLYAHLKNVNVTAGQLLKQGEQVGTIGKTGRATGPHLHWSMIMNQNLVDPLLFVPYRIVTAVPKAKNNA